MKDQFVIKGLGGRKTLSGEIVVNGAKNAILPVMCSSILFKDGFSMSNISEIEDLWRMFELLGDIGIKNEKIGSGKFKIDSSGVNKSDIDATISKKLRASVILTGPVLARFGAVSFPHPGGCVIGARPIDLFIDGFKKIGAEVSVKDERYFIKAKDKKLKGAEIFFKVQSVTATETFIMAGVLAKGKTVLKNVALEPEIKDLADFLISCGAKITGVGTTTIEITGGGLLQSGGKNYKAMPDRLETGSFLILGALCADNLEIKNCNPKDIEILVDMLKESGVPIEVGKSTLKIKNNGKIKNESFKGVNIKTHEYPGFPTDLQAPMTVFLTQANGESLIFETIFEGRLNYTEDLIKMGAKIDTWNSHKVMIKGPTLLKGKELDGPDIRTGFAFVIAALVAKQESIINNVYYIDRGYEKVEERLGKIGVDIKRIKNL